MKKLFLVLDDIKFQHTVFALPFAIMSTFLASNGIPEGGKFSWIILAMVAGRTSAMIFNRLVDAKIDRDNPRTKNRALPSGKINYTTYIAYLITAMGIFFLACYQLNTTCLLLSPVALLIIFFYSITKRFTSFSHFFLGIALSLAPLGAWIAIKETIAPLPLLLGGAVVFWLAGLDIIYSCQDVQFDKQTNLWSFPRKYGIKRALHLSLLFHGIMMIFLLSLAMISSLGAIYLTGIAVVAAFLWYEHSIVSPDDLSRVTLSFFNVNGIISVLLMVVVIADCLL